MEKNTIEKGNKYYLMNEENYRNLCENLMEIFKVTYPNSKYEKVIADWEDCQKDENGNAVLSLKEWIWKDLSDDNVNKHILDRTKITKLMSEKDLKTNKYTIKEEEIELKSVEYEEINNKDYLKIVDEIKTTEETKNTKN